MARRRPAERAGRGSVDGAFCQRAYLIIYTQVRVQLAYQVNDRRHRRLFPFLIIYTRRVQHNAARNFDIDLALIIYTAICSATSPPLLVSWRIVSYHLHRAMRRSATEKNLRDAEGAHNYHLHHARGRGATRFFFSSISIVAAYHLHHVR